MNKKARKTVKKTPKASITLSASDVESIIGAHVALRTAERVSLWLRLDNPMLNGLSPMQMILLGRGKQLEELVNDWLDSGWEESLTEDWHYCHDCNLAKGGVVPSGGGHRGITVMNGTCTWCGRKDQVLVPKADYHWPKEGRRAVPD